MEVWKIQVSCELHATIKVEADTKEKAETIALAEWQDEMEHLNVLLKGLYKYKKHICRHCGYETSR